MATGFQTPGKAYSDLSNAATELSSYGLKLAAKWASEQLLGLDFDQVTLELAASSPPWLSSSGGGVPPTRFSAPPAVPRAFSLSSELPGPSSPDLGADDDDFLPPDDDQDFTFSSSAGHSAGALPASSSRAVPPRANFGGSLGVGGAMFPPASSPSPPPLPPPPLQPTLVPDLALSASVTFSKSLLDLGEYDRAAHLLSVDGRPHPNLGGLGLFVWAYSLFLAGEKRKEEEMVEVGDPLRRCKVLNNNLRRLRLELAEKHLANALDPFGLYAYGVVLKELLQQEAPALQPNSETLLREATEVLVESLLAYPWNWSAWLDLAELCIDNSAIHATVEKALESIADSYMYHFFLLHVFVEQQQNDKALQLVKHISVLFPKSNHLTSQTALAYYNLRDFDRAQTCFLSLCDRDPFRLEQMDVFSNILYVKELKGELSHLAHTSVKADKYRPETCCIIGNYYSLKSQHEKAVLYFQRAVKLNRRFLSAWTLMGHEFVELRNTAAAIEAYRRAVDINRRDYRAWYGLGQTYEILNMLLYALYYYKKAASLRPYDARMWCAMGGCYLALDRREDAIKAYERAAGNNDREGIATKKLATLYREAKMDDKAFECYGRLVEALRPGHATELEQAEAEALLYMATAYKERGEYNKAAACCSRLLEYPGPEKEEAKALLREIRSRIS